MEMADLVTIKIKMENWSIIKLLNQTNKCLIQQEMQ